MSEIIILGLSEYYIRSTWEYKVRIFIEICHGIDVLNVLYLGSVLLQVRFNLQS